ncbi:hypothetical protein Q31b_16600 [Novipirellula aureliae]|uniref:GEVED domain-containing protein n=1 Tax=Novipirellula aureliae TaxID=2527966 RepID=A0A5C6E685_9BACT|nr:choice-of-anchor Q domain-containing protein [Novipirellula aureliae]TWU44125.1 hypothetical protein Q31b_16600 [Novipirellula aureliae]
MITMTFTSSLNSHHRRSVRHLGKRVLRSNHRRRLRLESLENRRLLASIIVNTLDDVVQADSQTSLREAITQANANPDADIISFASQLQGSRLELRDKVNSEFGNTMLTISSDITIVGPLEISRDTDDGDARLFFVESSGTLTLDTLTVSGGEAVGGKGGDADGGGGGGGGGFGGAIFNVGVLHIVDSTLTNNVARGGAGGRSGIDGLGGGGAAGGSIRRDAADSTTDTGATGVDGSGGGGNKTTGAGRPIGRFTVQFGDDGNATTAFGAGGGGGGFSQMTTFAPDTLAGGGSGGGGGFGGGGGGVGDSAGGENVVTQDAADGGFAGGEGRSAGGGGGAGLGGAIFNNFGTVSIRNSTLSANSAVGGMGGEGNARGTSFQGQSGSGFGGAVFNRSGNVTISQTTIVDNLARAGNFGDGGESQGGGVYHLQDSSGTASLSLTNTIVANSQFDRSDVVNDGGSVTGKANLIERHDGLPDDVIASSDDPKLGSLESNGGPTATHALLADSPAIDAGFDAQSTTPEHTYDLTSSLDDANNGSSLVSLGGAVTASGYQFGPNQGLTLSGANIDAATYSIEITFSLSEVDSYKKIIDFKNSELDSGLYVRANQLNFYGSSGSVASGGTIQPDVKQTLLFTRDHATKLVVGYLNGSEAIRFTDSSDLAVLSGPNKIVRFFEDDRGFNEASAGTAAQITLYNSVVGSGATVSAFDQRGESFARIVNNVIDIGAFESQIEVENTAPNVSFLGDLRVPINTPTKPIAFTLFDEQSSADKLTLNVVSSNETLVPSSAITLAGVAGNRTLIVNPAEAESGTSTITVTVTDPGGLTDQSQFVITVDPSNLSINFIYLDSGTGFDDPVLGQARRDALERAGRTFTSWFDHSGVIDIEVDPFTPNENTTVLASAGGYYPSTSNPGFGNPSPLEVELLTGVNNSRAVASMGVNFSNRNNFAFGDSINSNQQDFHATMLHELTHAFGFFGNIRSDGKSDLRGRDNVWGPYDQFVADSSGVAIIDPVTFLVDKPRWDAAKSNSLTFIGPHAMAANGGSPVPLYSPSVFNISDSVSHLDDDAAGISSRTHMMTSIAFKGLSAREFHPIERGIMLDLGYKLTGIADDSPTLSQVDAQSIAVNTATSSIPLTVFDAQTDVDDLTITATSSNTALVPNSAANLTLSGTGIGRAITVTPLPNQSGKATITMTVTDGDGLTDTQVFELNVAGVTGGLDLDFGDAPTAAQTGLAADYPVTIAQDGARHEISDLFLGSLIDAETDGIPDAQAGQGDIGGDDNDNTADEDGVFVLANIFTTSDTVITSSFEVIASAAGKVDAWIDFDQDGIWQESEHILDSVDVVAGSNVVSYQIPAGATAGSTGARFRLSTVGNLLPTGKADNGEVEDYMALVETANASILELTSVSSAAMTIESIGGEVIARQDQTFLFRGPLSAVGYLDYLGGDDDGTLILTASPSVFTNGIFLNADAGNDTLVLSGTSPILDVASLPANSIVGFEIIDLLAAASGKLILQESDVTGIPDAGKTLRVQMDRSDMLELSVDTTNNRDNRYAVTGTRVIDGKLAVQVKSDSASLEISGLNWTNPLNRFDVNNSGNVSAADALAIINALSDPVFSGADGTLIDPASVVDFSISKFLDPTGEGKLTANDALVIINFLSEVSSPPPAAEQIVTTLAQDIVLANHRSETKSTPEQPTPVDEAPQTVFTHAADDEVLARFNPRAIHSYVREVELAQADEDEFDLESTIAMLSTERRST